MATSGRAIPIMLCRVGLEDRRQDLIQLQPSLARVFDVIEIRAWSADETRGFFQKAFSAVGIVVDDGAMRTLVQFAGGFPVLAHEIGDAAFNLDTDNRITEDEANKAVLEAADIVGRKLLEPQVFRAIRSARYRSILRRLGPKTPFSIKFKRGEVLNLNPA